MNITELKALAESAKHSISQGHKRYQAEADFKDALTHETILELIAQLEDAQSENRALLATEQNLRERVKEMEEGLEKIKRGIDDELDPDWPCNSYHPNFIKAEEIARALLERQK